MINTLKQAWKTGDLKQRLLYTLLIIIVFRIGSIIPVPFLNTEALKGFMGGMSGGSSLLQYFDTLSGGAFAQATLFALSVQPNINASIIMQLMGVALPYLESLHKEGEPGRKKITAITRVLTIILGISQGFGYYMLLRNNGYAGMSIIKYTQGIEGIFAAIVIIAVLPPGLLL